MFWEDDFDEGLENFFDLQPVQKVQMVIASNKSWEVIDAGGTYITSFNHEMKLLLTSMRVYYL